MKLPEQVDCFLVGGHRLVSERLIHAGLESCAEQIADRIDAAKTSMRAQAYYLTQPTILRSIAAAKRRGLNVEAILDKSQDRRSSARLHSGATYLANAGVSV